MNAGSIIFFAVLLAIDLYVFKGLRTWSADWSPSASRWLMIGFWAISLTLSLSALFITNDMRRAGDPSKYELYYTAFGVLLMFLVPKLLFVVFGVIDDLQFGIRWIGSKLMSSPSEVESTGEQISRMRFLYTTGALLAAIPFTSIAYGMLKGRWAFRVIRKQIASANIPASFDGFKVVQISDAHVGSFFDNHKQVKRAIQMINDLEPDVLVFTGDMVNNFASEAESWIDAFGSLQAKYGKFSILGNHDYGDYSKWDSEEEKAANLNRLKEIHSEMGFRLLLNENERIDLNGDQIGLLGVENWGVPPFPQHGDLAQAKRGAENLPFKILLSHDPSHWDHVVRKEHSDIDLTLSGHTHGMQFGVELGNIKWSPVKYKYPKWAGLYTEGQQQLYVNRGFGYIGFPGRVGMPPEITLLELKATNS